MTQTSLFYSTPFAYLRQPQITLMTTVRMLLKHLHNNLIFHQNSMKVNTQCTYYVTEMVHLTVKHMPFLEILMIVYIGVILENF